MRIFLRLSACLLFFTGQAQPLNIAKHTAVDYTGNMVSVNSKFFYLETIENHCCAKSLYLKGLDEAGDSLFNFGFQTLPIQSAGRLIGTLDKALFLNYWGMMACDLTSKRDYIAKVDTNGKILFHVGIQPSMVNGYSPTIIDITQHSDGSYYLVSTTELYHYSATGQFISKIGTGLTDISVVKALSNGRLFISGKLSGNITNVEMSVSGTILKQQPGTTAINKVIENTHSYYARTFNGFIERYDTTLVLTAYYNSLTTNRVTDFTIRHDSLFVTGCASIMDGLYYGVLDTALTPLHVPAQTGYRGIVPSGIAVNTKNKVGVITTGRNPVSLKYPFSGFFRFDINGNFNVTPDIGITGFSNLDTRLESVPGSPSTPVVSMDVTVKNFGQDTVKSFYVNYYASHQWCLILFHKYYQATLAPGKTLTLPTGKFYGQPGYFGNKTGGKMKLCLFTTVPDGKNDRDIDNDAFCDSILFTITGIEKHLLQEEHVSVFPNPFKETISISTAEPAVPFYLADVLGRIYRRGFTEAGETEISTEDLPPGIYILSLRTDKGVITKKLVRS